MADFKKRILSRLAADAGEGSDYLLKQLDKPGRATRAAIDALQTDKDILPAIKAQFGEAPPEVPSGADIAERAGEKYDIQSPAALAAIATAADVIDPTMFVPGGQVSKIGKLGVLGKAAQKGKVASKAGKGVKVVDDAPKSFGKVSVKDPVVNPGKVQVRDPAPQSYGSVKVKDSKPMKPKTKEDVEQMSILELQEMIKKLQKGN